MLVNPDQNLHLTYCTNIHPGESWPQVRANLEQYLPLLKARLAPTASFGIGLRLADQAARQLLSGDALTSLQAWLAQHSLYVFTLNGFPFGGFHHQVVKEQVYAPDWSTPARLDYTLRLARILAELLPAGMEGSISTLPLSYKPWWPTPEARQQIYQESSHHLAKLVAELVRIQETAGKLLHVDLEPEPDGLLENTADVIHFFQDWLLPIGGRSLAQHLGISQAAAEAQLLNHVRLCYDTCHLAVAYEDPASALAQLQAVGIQIGKIQLSAALQVMLPPQASERQRLRQRLQPFAESTYLHQVVERQPGGRLHHYPDLTTALPQLDQTPGQEWRIHFHVPIFLYDYDSLRSTQADLWSVLQMLPTGCQHLEIETYTWEVLPPALKLDVLASIQREYEWVLASLPMNKVERDAVMVSGASAHA